MAFKFHELLKWQYGAAAAQNVFAALEPDVFGMLNSHLALRLAEPVHRRFKSRRLIAHREEFHRNDR